MSGKRSCTKKRILLFAAGTALLLCAGLAGCSAGTQTGEDPAAGRAYLEALESLSPDAVTARLKEQRHERLLAEVDELRAELEADPDSVWEQFHDYVIFGDSRTMGFTYLDLLPEENFITAGGATILLIRTNMDALVEKNPAYIYIAFGVNDVSCGRWDTPEQYVEEYKTILLEVHEQLPDAKIFVCSIVPVIDPAFETSAKWYNIPEFSEAVKEMCDDEELDFVYLVDLDHLMEDYPDQYQPDGIHLVTPVYAPWAIDMITATYNAEAEETFAAEEAEE